MTLLAASSTRPILPRYPLDSNHYHWWDCFGSSTTTSMSIPDIGSSSSPAALTPYGTTTKFGTVGANPPWGPRTGSGYPSTRDGMRATCTDLTDTTLTVEALVLVSNPVTAGIYGSYLHLSSPTYGYRMGVFQYGPDQPCLFGVMGPDGDQYINGNALTPSDGQVHSIGWTFDRAGAAMRVYWDGAQVGIRASFAPTTIPSLVAVDVGQVLGGFYIDNVILSCGISNIARPQSYFQSVAAQITASSSY